MLHLTSTHLFDSVCMSTRTWRSRCHIIIWADFCSLFDGVLPVYHPQWGCWLVLQQLSSTIMIHTSWYIHHDTAWYVMIRHDTSKPSQIAMSGAGQRCYQRHHQRDPSSKMPRRTKTMQEQLKRSSEGKGMAKLWWTLPQTFYSIWSTVLIGQMWLGI
jgi:hypothetical protein